MASEHSGFFLFALLFFLHPRWKLELNWKKLNRFPFSKKKANGTRLRFHLFELQCPILKKKKNQSFSTFSFSYSRKDGQTLRSPTSFIFITQTRCEQSLKPEQVLLTVWGPPTRPCRTGPATSWRGRRWRRRPPTGSRRRRRWRSRPPAALTRTPRSARRGTTSSPRHDTWPVEKHNFELFNFKNQIVVSKQDFVHSQQPLFFICFRISSSS